MQTVIVLFNLKPGIRPEEYETWARDSDLPVVGGLQSMQKFEVLKASGLLIGDGTSPYEYFEIMRISDMDAFAKELNGEDVQAGAARFQQYADNPVFILADAL